LPRKPTGGSASTRWPSLSVRCGWSSAVFEIAHLVWRDRLQDAAFG
jgi:hypothetical protein